MSATELQQAGRVGLLSSQAGDAVGGFATLFFGEDLGAVALDTEDLADVGEVQVVVEFAAGPDVTDFQPPVGFIDGGVRRGEKRSD